MAGDQGNHKNFDPSLLTNKFWLVFMGIKQKNFFFEKKNQNGWLKKTEFFKIANSETQTFVGKKSLKICLKIFEHPHWKVTYYIANNNIRKLKGSNYV